MQACSGGRSGLGDDAEGGERVRLTPDGFEPIEGVVDHVSPSFLGRAFERRALPVHRLGFEGASMIGHHLFADGVDQEQAEHGLVVLARPACSVGDGDASG